MKGLILTAFFVLTACAQAPVKFSEDITLVAWQSAEAVDSVRFPAESTSGDLEFCVARNVVNNSVTFSDSADSFFGAYTGTYYHDTDSQTVGGGSVIQHSSDKGVIAVGVTSYQASTFVKRYVRFKLIAMNNEYEFANLEQVQADSGSAPNTGFHPVGAFAGAAPDKVVASLKSIAEKIDECRR